MVYPTYLGFRVNLNNGGIEGRELGNIVVLAFTLFFLELEGDTTDGSTRNALHQVSGETSNLVTKTLGSNDSNLVANLLVGLEIESKTGVVLLDQNAGSLLDSLGSNATLKIQSNLVHPSSSIHLHPSLSLSIHRITGW